MFCPVCGTQLSDDAKFCGVCGTPIGTTNMAGQAVAAVATVNSAPYTVPDAEVQSAQPAASAGTAPASPDLTASAIGAAVGIQMKMRDEKRDLDVLKIEAKDLEARIKRNIIIGIVLVLMVVPNIFGMYDNPFFGLISSAIFGAFAFCLPAGVSWFRRKTSGWALFGNIYFFIAMFLIVLCIGALAGIPAFYGDLKAKENYKGLIEDKTAYLQQLTARS